MGVMFAPRRDWTDFENRTRAAEIAWLRGLTPADKFAIYCDLFSLVHQVHDPRVDRHRLEQRRWQQKLADRRIAVEAFRKLDEWRGRTH